jgi:hypothetical protein
VGGCQAPAPAPEWLPRPGLPPLSPSHHCSQWGGRCCIRGGATISTATRSYRLGGGGGGPEELPVNPLGSRTEQGRATLQFHCLLSELQIAYNCPSISSLPFICKPGFTHKNLDAMTQELYQSLRNTCRTQKHTLSCGGDMYIREPQYKTK